jgi:hypothetical protein
MNAIAESPEEVKSELMNRFSSTMDRMFAQADAGARPRALELALWSELVGLGALVLSYLFAMLCRRAMEQDVESRGLRPEDIRLRPEAEYWHKVTTTFGPVSFPTFAYRERRGGAEVTRSPAHSVFPYHRRCRSSELCLEWECRLGSDHPFRQAQEALTFFTHEAVRLEDTTIQAHLVSAAQLIDRTFLYRDADSIRQILSERATRDRVTGEPLLYMSCDAHAICRLEDGTWDTHWKMANGIRLWCEDRRTGNIIHLGGEFLWGDYTRVVDAFSWLNSHGILPPDGDYGDGVVAKLCWLSDGMPWFSDHILPLFLSPVVILDVYHLLERLAAYAALCYGKGSRAARRWYSMAVKLVCGPKAKKRKPKPRRGTGGRAGKRVPKTRAHQRTTEPPERAYKMVKDLGLLLASTHPKTKKAEKAKQKLGWYIIGNVFRMDYATYRYRGYQIGSGAMESIHRQGSQIRTKLPGASWLEYTSQAIFNVRMMRLAGNWDRFWHQEDLAEKLVHGFEQARELKRNAA